MSWLVWPGVLQSSVLAVSLRYGACENQLCYETFKFIKLLRLMPSSRWFPGIDLPIARSNRTEWFCGRKSWDFPHGRDGHEWSQESQYCQDWAHIEPNLKSEDNHKLVKILSWESAVPLTKSKVSVANPVSTRMFLPSSCTRVAVLLPINWPFDSLIKWPTTSVWTWGPEMSGAVVDANCIGPTYHWGRFEEATAGGTSTNVGGDIVGTSIGLVWFSLTWRYRYLSEAETAKSRW